MRSYVSALFLSVVSVIAGLSSARAQPSALFSDRYEQATYAEALERIKGNPNRHAMIYFGMYTGCPPCNFTRNVLNGATLRELYHPSVVLVYVDLRHPKGEAEQALIKKYKASWAPTLVFVDARGRSAARFARGFSNEREGVLLHEFITQRLYTKTNAQAYIAANFNAEGRARTIPDARAALKPAFQDDRMTLGELKKLPHERVSREDLQTRLPGSALHHEARLRFANEKAIVTSQGEWKFDADGGLAATSRREGKTGIAHGSGQWRVNETGQLCYEIQWPTRKANACSWVYRVGDEFFLVTKDVDSARIYLRLTLAEPD